MLVDACKQKKFNLLSAHIVFLIFFLNAYLDKWCVINMSKAQNQLGVLYLDGGHF